MMIRTRTANLLGFGACAGMLGYAFFSQFVLKLEPCPLCIFQRIGVLAMGLVFLAAFLHDPQTGGRRVYAALMALASGVTVAIAVRHLYIQSLPPGTVPACGASLKFMLKVRPLNEVLSRVLNGSGECAIVNWRFLGLTMPAWVLACAAAVGACGIWVNLRSTQQVARS